jgi:hypothetical protein
MTKFRTYLIVNNQQSKIIEKLDFSKSNFKIVLDKEPTNCFWESSNGHSETIYSAGRNNLEITNENEQPQLELIINSKTEDIADNALSLLKGGILLAIPLPSISFLDLYVSKIIKSNNKFFKDKVEPFKKLNNIEFGCQVLEKIIKNRECSYALEKYKVSLELFALNPFSVDPRYGQFFENYNTKKQLHTRAAFAIISAFSVIEELGLEIRSSAKKPRFNNNETGEWNPLVLNDIENRLESVGIKNDETFDWVFRGEKTKVEKNLKPYFGYDSQWIKYGDEIRDKTLTIPEAIHNASYLRNFIASHKFKELTEYISPYDVYNVQALARMLILKHLGMWELIFKRN